MTQDVIQLRYKQFVRLRRIFDREEHGLNGNAQMGIKRCLFALYLDTLPSTWEGHVWQTI